jgi:bacillithiol biosynthesis cysteine-adding enzyme BshC
VSGARVVTEPLGGSPLSLAVQAGDAPRDWHEPRPTTAAAWRARAEHVVGQFADRDWLAGLRPAIAASGGAADRLERVVSEGGVVVTTGQQPGLFGGPVYTWTKALTALALADELEARTNLPVAPVFWAATDDADFDEAGSTNVVLDGQVVRLEQRERPPPGTPMFAATLGDLRDELRELDRAAGSAAFRGPLEAARAAYQDGETVGGAYVALLRSLLAPLGIAVLDASHAAVRAQGRELLRQALVRAKQVSEALAARDEELRRAGFEPQVASVGDLSLVFSVAGAVKRRVPLTDADAVATASADALAPNVLLRPVMERAILPTVAYCGGPAELAYFAQVTAVADALVADRPLAVPRWSATILEPHVTRILDRLSVDYTDLRDSHALEGRLARAALPREVVEALERIRGAIQSVTEELVHRDDRADLIPPAAVNGARSSMLARLQRLERRYVAAAKRREQESMRRIAIARAHLYPDGKRQERVLNFLPMLARAGAPLLDAMREAARAHAKALVTTGFASGDGIGGRRP